MIKKFFNKVKSWLTKIKDFVIEHFTEQPHGISDARQVAHIVVSLIPGITSVILGHKNKIPAWLNVIITGASVADFTAQFM